MNKLKVCLFVDLKNLKLFTVFLFQKLEISDMSWTWYKPQSKIYHCVFV